MFSLLFLYPTNVYGLSILSFRLEGNCYFTIESPLGKIGMDFEKGYSIFPEEVVYQFISSTLYYVTLVDPKEGTYKIRVVGRGYPSYCKVTVSTRKIEGGTTFEKSLSFNLNRGESLKAGFMVYKFNGDIQLWNLAPGSGREPLDETYKPYLRVLPNNIRVGFLNGENQAIPILIKVPSCIPPGETSCVILPAKNITISITNITGGEAPVSFFPLDHLNLSANNFPLDAGASKIVWLKVKIPENIRKVEHNGFITIKSKDIGENVILLDLDPQGPTIINPLLPYPSISFERGEVTLNFFETTNKSEIQIDIPEEANLSLWKLLVNFSRNLEIPTSISIKHLTEEELESENISIASVGNERDVYQILEINSEENLIRGTKLIFKVPKEWLGDKEIALLKFEGNTWKPQNIEIESKDSKYIYFSTTSPTLSIYLITKFEPASTPLISELSPKDYFTYIYIGVAILILILVLIFVLRKRRKPKPEYSYYLTK